MREIITFITLCVLAASPLMVDGSFQDQDKKADPKDPPKTFTNSIGMKFVWIPPGNFVMDGSHAYSLANGVGEELTTSDKSK